MTRQLHRRLNVAQRDSARLARAATVKYAPPRPAGKPNPLSRKETEMPIDNPFVPLVTIAAELGTDATNLARRLDGAVQLDGIGLRCVSRETAAAVIAEHAAQQQARAERQQRRRAEADARRAALAQQTLAGRERIRALQRRDEELRAAGVIDDDVPAYTVMTAGAYADRLTRAGERFDEMLSAGNTGYVGTYHPVRRNPEE